MRGFLMIGINSTVLEPDDIRRLKDERVGGVILFRRNFIDKNQLVKLVEEIHALRKPQLIIAVDHEGGRVQRFKNGFTALPSMRTIGQIVHRDGLEIAKDIAYKTGFVLAAELRECGLDFSFTPVLDLDYGRCTVIGDRSFHRDPNIVAELAKSLQNGLRAATMSACGKHFPSHGYVQDDSHCTLPHDTRTTFQDDLFPYATLIDNNLEAIMPAHVCYDALCPHAAGFSRYWLQDVLRNQYHFNGLIFSDDLGMEGAAIAGDIQERARAALDAGCDILLICNRPDWVDALLSTSMSAPTPDWQKVKAKGTLSLPDDFAIWQETVAALYQNPEIAPTVGEAH